MLIFAIMLVADFGKLPYAQLEKIPYYDIIGHFFLYGIASFVCHRATNRRMMMIFHLPIPFGPFLFTLVTIAEEVLQHILPHRTFSLLDLGASLIGIVLFYKIGEIWFPQNSSQY
ncbi:hypothetical protein WN50_31790 [Limnoraphis robusta CS-951]|uniref:VanZ-like domain-containing protein n=2 Tax=Limnoraphis TaxID=1332112 RepID=A0A0J9EXR1_9CYAN|nr:hypothetical protein WN50_31790 [Limnoraphis robusta CS-951]